MPRKVVGVVSLLLHAVAILLQAASLLPVPWYSFAYENSDFTFSLFSCVDCQTPFRNISPDCFKGVYCKNNPSGLCSLGPDLQQGADFYFFATCLSLLFLVLNIERLLALLRGRDYGHPKVLLAMAPLPLLVTVIGVVGWYASVKPEFQSCGDSQGTEEPCVTAKAGAFIALVGAVAVLGALPTLLVTFFKRDRKFDSGVTGIGEGKIIAFTFRNWLLAKVGPVLLVGIVFIGVSFILPWIKFKDSSSSYQGDLQQLLDSWNSQGETRYECLWGPACDVSNASSSTEFSCTVFKRLSLANSIYLGLECCVLLFLVLWVESLIYFALKREFGFPKLVYCWAPLTTLVHIAAVSIWFIYGKASMSGSCEIEPGDTDVSLCAENGASFTVWEGLCLFFAAIFYELLYYRRRDGYLENDSVSPALPSKIDQTDSDIVEPPTMLHRAFEASQPTPIFSSKGTAFGSRAGTHFSAQVPNSQGPNRPTLETLEEKVYCVSCDDE